MLIYPINVENENNRDEREREREYWTDGEEQQRGQHASAVANEISRADQSEIMIQGTAC